MTRKTARILVVVAVAVLVGVALGMKSQFDFYRPWRVLPIAAGASLGLISLSLAIGAMRGGKLALATFVLGVAAIVALSIVAHERDRDRGIRAYEQERALNHAAIGVCDGKPAAVSPASRTIVRVEQGSVGSFEGVPAPSTIEQLDLVACRSSFAGGCGRRVTIEMRDARTATVLASKTFPESLPPGCDPFAIAPNVERIGEPPDERAIAAFVKSFAERR